MGLGPKVYQEVFRLRLKLGKDEKWANRTSHSFIMVKRSRFRSPDKVALLTLFFCATGAGTLLADQALPPKKLQKALATHFKTEDTLVIANLSEKEQAAIKKYPILDPNKDGVITKEEVMELQNRIKNRQ